MTYRRLTKEEREEEKRQRHGRILVRDKGSPPLTRREISYLFRNDRAKAAAGFVEPDPEDPWERFQRMMNEPLPKERKT